MRRIKKQVVDLVLFLQNPNRRFLVLLHDFFAALLSVQLGFWLYYGDNLSYFSDHFVHKQMFVFALLCMGFFFWFQTYRGVWRFISWKQISVIAGAILLASLIYLPILTKANVENIRIPKILVLWIALTALGLLLLSRFLYRLGFERWILPETNEMARDPISRIILVNLSRHLEKFIEVQQRKPQADYDILGIVSDKNQHTGRTIHDVPVLGTLEDLPDLIENFNADGEHPHQVVLTGTHLNGQRVRALKEMLQAYQVNLCKLDTTALSPSKISPEIRPIDLEDLFTHPVYLDPESELGEFYKSKTILITGASSVVGRQLAKFLLKVGVHNLLLCDQNHLALMELKDDVFELLAGAEAHFIVTYQFDQKKYQRLLTQYQPQIVIHLDTITEQDIAPDNTLTTISENILTTRMLSQLAHAQNIAQFCFVLPAPFGSDEVLGPLSLSVAEAYTQAHAKEKGAATTQTLCIRLPSVLSPQNEFCHKALHLLRQQKPLKVLGTKKSYSVTEPRAAAFSILKGLFLLHQTPALNGTSLQEVLHDMVLPETLALYIADLHHLDGLIKIDYEIPTPLNANFAKPNQEVRVYDQEQYMVATYKTTLAAMDQLCDALQAACDQFDQNRALGILKAFRL